MHLVTIALAGMPHRSRMRLMPPLRRDPAAKSRYSELAIRTLYSSRPIVQMLGQPNNKERSYDRTPGTPMSQSEPMDVLDQSEFTKLNFDPMNLVEIIENIPVRCEVVGVSTGDPRPLRVRGTDEQGEGALLLRLEVVALARGHLPAVQQELGGDGVAVRVVGPGGEALAVAGGELHVRRADAGWRQARCR